MHIGSDMFGLVQMTEQNVSFVMTPTFSLSSLHVIAYPDPMYEILPLGPIGPNYLQTYNANKDDTKVYFVDV